MCGTKRGKGERKQGKPIGEWRKRKAKDPPDEVLSRPSRWGGGKSK